MTKMEQKKWKNRLAMAFLFTTAALLLLGIIMQILCEAMGYGHYLLKYLLGLIPAAGAFFLLYYAVVRFHDAGTLLRILISLLLIAVLGWSVLIGLAVAYAQLEEDQFVVYKFYAWTYPEDEVRYMLSKSQMFGRGDPYYTYPDGLLEGYDRHQDDLPQDVIFAFDERDRAKAVFEDFRKFHTLPVLSYTYGLWVNWLFALLAVIWCIAAGVVSFQVYRWWEKLTYLLMFALVALQLVLPLLGTFGKINCWISHPFSANWLMNTTLTAPQLGIMHALVKTSRPREKLLMEPGADYWREIIGED